MPVTKLSSKPSGLDDSATLKSVDENIAIITSLTIVCITGYSNPSCPVSVVETCLVSP